MTRVNSGIDIQARALGGDSIGGKTSGTASSVPTGTTFTDATAGWTVNGLVGHYLGVAGVVFGIVISNTATVATVDFWHQGSSPGSVTPGATPANGAAYQITPGSAPARWLGLTTATRAIAGADLFLTSDGTTVSELWASGGGLNRTFALTFGHTAGVASYTLSNPFTCTAADNGGATVTVHRCGAFLCGVTAAPTTATSGPMFTATDLNADAVLVPTALDVVTVTETVNL
jgi:hypothetical protein